MLQGCCRLSPACFQRLRPHCALRPSPAPPLPLRRFTTNSGTVSAAHDWDEPVQVGAVRDGGGQCRSALPHARDPHSPGSPLTQVMRVRPGLPGSVEHLFHRAAPGPQFALDLRRGGDELRAELRGGRGLLLWRCSWGRIGMRCCCCHKDLCLC